MSVGYFHRVTKETPTRFWVNNPSGPDMELALAASAINVTTNPSYCSRLITNEPEYIRGVIDTLIKEIDDDDIAADRIYQEAALRVMKKFFPLYERSEGVYGYVTIQGDPRADEDPDAIVNAALQCSKLGKNFMAKIPVTLAGTQAIDTLVARDIPICATEVFSLSQAIYICELYQRAAKKCAKDPPFYVTHITGIFDEYLAEKVKREGIEISPEVFAQAGCAVARKEYQILKRRGYETTMLDGGARGTHNFTELVGGDVHITINWSTARELIEADGPVISRIEAQIPRPVLDELTAKLPDFRKAFYEDALSLEEFKDYGPVRLFRSMFLAGYDALLREIAERRRMQKNSQASGSLNKIRYRR